MVPGRIEERAAIMNKAYWVELSVIDEVDGERMYFGKLVGALDTHDAASVALNSAPIGARVESVEKA